MSVQPKTRRPLAFASLVDWARSVDIVSGLLAMGVLVYIVVFTLAAWFKYDTYLMGFDLGVHEQVLWNTAHGRIAASSAFAGTESYLGIDIIPTELLLTPLYALAPSAYTMLFLQTLVLALGSVPVFLLARDRIGTPWAGLVFAAAFLLYQPVEYMNLYEFQIRAFATTFLLCALLFAERGRRWPFLLFALLALGCRSDVGLVIAGMGLYSILGRRSQIVDLGNRTFNIQRPTSRMLFFGLLPIVLGLGWTLLCVQVLVPAFRNGAPFLYTQVIYGWMGATPGEMLKTLLLRPGVVATHVFTADRLRYLLEMFLPFGFLLLLQPRMLLITLPIFALNLLSNSPNIHASTHYHYQALIIPFMVVGSAYGLHWLLERLRAGARWRAIATGVVLMLALLCNIGFRNPFFSLLTRPVDHARIAGTARLLAQVPPDASLTVTNTLGPHAARREQLFFFPGNVIYPVEKVGQGEYLLIDPADTNAEGLQLLAKLEASGRYQRIAEDQGVSLWHRIEPGQNQDTR